MSDEAAAVVDNDSLVGLLNQLAEVPDPTPVSMVPQTAGWAVLAVILFLCVAWAAWKTWRKYQANAYRRAALKALSEARDDPAMISDILKRTALVAYGRRRVAALSGQRWLAFLEETGTGQFFGTALADAAYRKAPVGADPTLTKAARNWVKDHEGSEGEDV